MKRLLLSLLLVAGLVSAQEQKIEIRGFGGLNTIADEFHIGVNEATVAHNIDFSRQMGAISKRLGYDSLSAMAGVDSIIAIYPAYYSDGTEQLFIVVDTGGNGIGHIYVTAKGSNDISSATLIWSYWSVFGYPSFAATNDDVYITNGYSRSIVYSNGIAREFPTRSPSEPHIIPVKDDGNLNGKYIYAFYVGDSGSVIQNSIDTTYDSTWWGCDSVRIFHMYYVYICDSFSYAPIDIDSITVVTSIDTTVSNLSSFRQSSLSSPVMVENGKMLLAGFEFPNTDSVNTEYSTNGARIIIARTKGDYLRITETTPIYYVTDFVVPTSDSAGNYSYLDNIADADLTNNLGLTVQSDFLGRDSLGSIHTYYGAPGYVSSGAFITYDSAVGDDTANFGIYYGIPNQEDTLGVYYVATIIDTVTGNESDTGRGCYIFIPDDSSKSGHKKPYSYVITLPKILSSDSGLVINLYRGLILQMTYDSSFYRGDTLNNSFLWTFVPETFKNGRSGIDKHNFLSKKWIDYFAVDTVVRTIPYLVGQFTVTDTMFEDSIRWDSVSTRRPYFKRKAPSLLSSIFSFGGRLYGVYGSRLYRSSLLNNQADTIQEWGAMDFQSLNEDDGDIGTIAYPMRTAIRFHKNRSNYNIYDDFSKTEISGYWGCVAPKSYAAGIGGVYYLTDEGVVRESEGDNLERTFTTQLVSAKLDNFDKMTIKTKSRAYGFYHDQKYYLYVPSPIDTTYIYDERADAWSTASLKFGSSGLYGVQSGVEFLPGDTIYFTKPGKAGLYRFGSSETDNGAKIPISWRSAPLLVDEYLEKVNSVGMWCISDSSYDSIAVYVLDESKNTDGVAYFPSLNSRYVKRGVECNNFLYFYMNLSTFIGSEVNMGSAYINGIDINYQRLGSSLIE